MKKNFVIVSAPRTGSTLLARTLDSLKGVCCHGELFQPAAVRGYRDGFDPTKATVDERQDRAKKLLEERNRDHVNFINQALSTEDSATGFKLIYSQILSHDLNAVRQSLVSMPDIKFIHLVRKNSLRRYVSWMVLGQGGAIHSGAGGRGEEKLQVHINIEAFKRHVALIEAQRQDVCEILSGQDVFNVTYEELSEETGLTVSRICQFLGLNIDKCSITPALEKVGAADLSESVSNFQELLDDPFTRDFAVSD